MDLGLRGRRALVTGASQGIGRAIAEGFAREGCDLHIASRGAEALERAAAEIRARHGVRVDVHATDLARRGAPAELAAACADVDIVVNNAGNTPRGDILSVDEQAWRDGWELKIFGYIAMMRAVYGRMCERGSGVIVNVTGIGADKLEYAYAAGGSGNAAIATLTRSIGSVSMEFGVRVMAVSPGWVETEKAKRSLRRRAASELGDEARWPELVRDWPRGRLIQPAEIADVVVFVASERASAMSGQVVTVDAGMVSRGYPPPSPLVAGKARAR